MYCTPCARLMKSITPNTSVSPAAIRNSSTPSCRPFRVCTKRSVMLMRRASSLAPRSGERVPSKRQRTGQVMGNLQGRASRCPSSGSLRSRPSPRKRGEKESSLHRAILHVRVRIILEHLLHDLGLVLTVGALGDLHQIEVLDRIVVGVELEGAAQRLEVRL